MRIPKAVLALAAVGTLLLAGCNSTASGTNSNATSTSANSAAASAPAASPTSEKTSSPATQGNADTSGLPPWQTSAPGEYLGKIFEPSNSKIIQTITGSGTDITDPVLYKPSNLGNGAQVRFACSSTLLKDGVHYFSMTVGRDLSNYEAVPADGTSGSFFFNWDWLSIGDGVQGLIYAWGDCKWQIRLLTFSPQPLPTM